MVQSILDMHKMHKKSLQDIDEGRRKKERYMDAISVKWRLEQMQMVLMYDRYFEATQKAANGLLCDAGIQLNNNQLAISVAAAHRLQRGKARQMYCVPTGQGKSMCMVGIMASLALYSGLDNLASNRKKFNIVYSNQKLLDSD